MNKTDGGADTRFFVAPDGNDGWSGHEQAPNAGGSDGPFLTFTAARAAIRALKQGPGLPDGGVTVCIRGGEYRLAGTFELTAEDSGTTEAPVLWTAFPGETVRIVGGAALNDCEPVTDEWILGRLDPACRGHVCQVDLGAHGLEDFGELDPRSGHRMELYFRGRFMEAARYPSDGWLTIADVPQTGETVFEEIEPQQGGYRERHAGRFTYDGDRPTRWADSDDIWVHGYWVFDWADGFHRVAAIDTDKKDVSLAAPHHTYGYRKGQPFYFLNILEELDTPGEWYLDRTAGMLYLWPPEPPKAGDLYVSIVSEDLVRLSDTSFLTVQDLDFAVARGTAVRVTGGTRNRIAGCRFSNLGQYAVVVEAGTENCVTGCDIHDVASGGIRLSGGDRRTLTPGRSEVTNNHVHHYGIRIRTYDCAVQLGGVGNRIAHNLIHDAPHMAIGWSGNEHVIEYNEVHDVVTETNDAGACYNGRDPSQQGTIIRYNYWHDIGRIRAHGNNAVYFDDALCGNTVFGNVFYKAGLPGRAEMGAVFIHGGRYNVIENNVFIDCERAYGETPWNDEIWERQNTLHDWHKRLYEAVNVAAPPYTDKYPWIQDIATDKRPNILARNLVYTCGAFRGMGEQELIDNLETDDDPGFIDAAHQDFGFKEDATVYDRIPGFQRIPFEKIGLYADACRPGCRAGCAPARAPASARRS